MEHSAGFLMSAGGWRLVARRLAVVGCVGLGAVFSAGMPGRALGQAATTLVMPQGPLLPETFGSWTAAGGGGEAAGAMPESPLVTGESSEVLKEDGARRSGRMMYKPAAGSGSMTVDAVQFDDATGAASAFTLLRTAGMKELPEGRGVGRQAAREGSRTVFREGPTVVVVDGGMVEDLKRLAATLPKIGGPRGLSPLLPTYLPAEGLIAESVHYAVGPKGYQAMGGVLPAGAMGFDKSAEAVTARYAGKGVLTLLLYPTPQIAGDRGRAVESQMNAAGAAAGGVKMRREGPMVMVASGGFKPEEAERVIRDIHLRTELTWNKQMPLEFHSEVRKTASLLTSIMVLSGVLGLAAVLLGVFLGLGRAWIRVLMGKPAAIEPEFLRLDLRNGGDGGGLVSKK